MDNDKFKKVMESGNAYIIADGMWYMDDDQKAKASDAVLETGTGLDNTIAMINSTYEKTKAHLDKVVEIGYGMDCAAAIATVTSTEDFLKLSARVLEVGGGMSNAMIMGRVSPKNKEDPKLAAAGDKHSARVLKIGSIRANEIAVNLVTKSQAVAHTARIEELKLKLASMSDEDKLIHEDKILGVKLG